MLTFIICIALLVAGYFVYGRYLDRQLDIDAHRPTPAYTCTDGVDFVPLSTPRIFLIQFLNIAGLGPIYGAIMGAMYGPVVFLWITFGTLLAGAAHDYVSGMVSLRSGGQSLPEIIGEQLGLPARQVIRLFTLALMILVGAVFASGPADILTSLTGGWLPQWGWLAIVFAYYVIATLFPVDKIIGRIYPIFGLALFVMAIAIFGAMALEGSDIPNLTDISNWRNMHPQADSFPIFPFLFVTVACGAISGFHATQSPLMARCIKTEKDGRKVFFGAMVAEGIIAMVWAAAAMSFFGGVTQMQEFMATHGNSAALAVKEISMGWLGSFGQVLVLLGVVAAPITSGDTAFRSARLIVADVFKISQKPFIKRLLVAIPLFVIAFIILQLDFGVVWRYFAWCNQTLAVFTLWAMTLYLARNGKNYATMLLPAILMTGVSVAYIMMAGEGFSLPSQVGYATAGATVIVLLGMFALWLQRQQNKD